MNVATTNLSTFYIPPDFTIPLDNFNLNINVSLANPSSFASALNASLGTTASSYGLSTIAVGAEIAVQLIPIFESTNSNVMVTGNTVSFWLTNTDGTI